MATTDGRVESLADRISDMIEDILPADVGFFVVLYREDPDGRIFSAYQSSDDEIGQRMCEAMTERRNGAEPQEGLRGEAR